MSVSELPFASISILMFHYPLSVQNLQEKPLLGIEDESQLLHLRRVLSSLLMLLLLLHWSLSTILSLILIMDTKVHLLIASTNLLLTHLSILFPWKILLAKKMNRLDPLILPSHLVLEKYQKVLLWESTTKFCQVLCLEGQVLRCWENHTNFGLLIHTFPLIDPTSWMSLEQIQLLFKKNHL